MRRLGGEDSGFLALETPEQPMNVMAVFVLRAPEPLDLAALERHVGQRLPLIPVLRWRLKRVPFGLGHPSFVDDPCFAIRDHLRELVLTEPDREAELDRHYARFAEERLDRGRPLWDLTLVHGLRGGRQAVVVRLHHCLMDGYATLHLFDLLLSDPELPLDDWVAARAPRSSRLLARALRERGRALRQLPGLVRRTQRSRASVDAARTGPDPAGDVPACLINRAYEVGRVFARTTLPLDDLLRVKRAAGVTLNDVALAVVAGSLRDYLLRRDGLPVRPLVTGVPVSLEPAGAPARTSGNHLASLTVPLATDVVDPWDRLLTIGASTREAKRLLAMDSSGLLSAWLEVLPPVLLDRGIRTQERKRRADPTSAPLTANTVVSNVRGLRGPRRLGTAAVEAMWLSGPPNSGVGTNVVLMDHEGVVYVGLMCFADCVDTPTEITDGMTRALADLVAAARTGPLSGVVVH